MANHQSSEKRIRQTEKEDYTIVITQRLLEMPLESYAMTEKETAADLLPKVSAMLDKLAKNILSTRTKQLT